MRVGKTSNVPEELGEQNEVGGGGQGHRRGLNRGAVITETAGPREEMGAQESRVR